MRDWHEMFQYYLYSCYDKTQWAKVTHERKSLFQLKDPEEESIKEQ